MSKEAIPTAEQMNRLVPSSWPVGWVELLREVDEGKLLIMLGHLSPAPEFSCVEFNNIQHLNVANFWMLPADSYLSERERKKYDFIAAFRITYATDSEIHLLDLNQTLEKVTPELDEAAIKLHEALKTMELSEEDKKTLESVQELMGTAKTFTSMVSEGEYLGAKARIIDNKFPSTVSIGRFIIDGPFIGSERLLFPSNKSIHSLKCYEIRFSHQAYNLAKEGYPTTLTMEDRILKRSSKAYFVMLAPTDSPIEFKPIDPKPICKCKHCTFHYRSDCSTLKSEGFINREEVELLIKGIFSKIKRCPFL